MRTHGRPVAGFVGVILVLSVLLSGQSVISHLSARGLQPGVSNADHAGQEAEADPPDLTYDSRYSYACGPNLYPPVEAPLTV